MTDETIEFQSELDVDANVLVCRSTHTDKLYVHLCPDDVDKVHGDDTTRVASDDYEYVEINEVGQ